MFEESAEPARVLPGPGAGGANCQKARGGTGPNILINIHILRIYKLETCYEDMSFAIYVHIYLDVFRYRRHCGRTLFFLW